MLHIIIVASSLIFVNYGKITKKIQLILFIFFVRPRVEYS